MYIVHACQHVPIYLQLFLRYSGISVASDWFSTVLVSEWVFFNHILLSQHRNRSMYNDVHICLQPFTRYSEILVGNCNFSYPLHLTPPYGVAPGTIAVYVTWMEKEFNACQTHRSMYPFILNRFPLTQPVSSKVLHLAHFCTFWPPWVGPWDNRGKCHLFGKRIQCWSKA